MYIIYCLVNYISIALLFLSGAVSNVDTVQHQLSTADKTVKILTIGNSFARDACAFLPEIVSSVKGCKIQIAKANIGGASLEKHATLINKCDNDPSLKPYGDEFTLKELLTRDKYDYVIIQQVSYLSFKPESITTGSSRDICAAYNRAPALFKEKIERLIISVGDSYGLEGLEDTNTSHGVNAWKGLMRSGLPIDWMPTNPSKGRGGPSRYCSYWYFIQKELLQQVPENIQAFMKSEDIAPQSSIQRHMWSTPAFIEISGKKCHRVKREVKWMSPHEADIFPEAKYVAPYEFEPVKCSLNDQGIARWELADKMEHTNVRILRINDYYLYIY